MPSSGTLALLISLGPAAEVVRSSCEPEATLRGAGPRSSVVRLRDPGIQGALDPVQEHPQNRTESSGHTVAVEGVRTTSSAAHADLEIPLVDGLAPAVSRLPRGEVHWACWLQGSWIGRMLAASGLRGRGRDSRVTPL